jgi:hypothetical protein
LNDGNNVIIPSGQTVAYFRIGYDLFTLTREIIIKFSYVSGKVNGATTFAEIKPLKVIIAPSTSVPVKITEFAALAAGGRSMPLAVYLDKAPFTQLTVGIYQLGRLPDRFGIYPPQLVFEPGEKKKFFWISTDFASKGSIGSLVFTMTGTTKGVYSFPARQKDFYIYEGRNAKPVILFQNIYGPTKNNQLIVSIKTDTHCTCYFAVVPRGTLDVLFSEVKNKKLRYDNFKGKYMMGEMVFSNTENTIDFAISDLEPNMDQMLKVFIQNTDGAIADAIYYPFTTLQPETPIKVYIQSSTDAIAGALITTLQGGIALGSRITTTQPDPNTYFEQKKIGETVEPIPYPANTMNADLQAKKDEFINAKIKPVVKPKTPTTGITGTIGAGSGISTVSSGASTVTSTTGIGGTDEINKLNQKTQALDLTVDLGKTTDQFLKETQEINKFRLKKVQPLTQGQEITLQEAYTYLTPVCSPTMTPLPSMPTPLSTYLRYLGPSGSSSTSRQRVGRPRLRRRWWNR